MNDNGTGTFILGVVAAVVLFLLWKKERGEITSPVSQPGVSTGPTGAGATCGAGCGGGCGVGGSCAAAPSADVSPAVQAAMIDSGLSGQISPGTPPLGGVDTSFYASQGPTSDASFTFVPASAPSGNVPSSASTPAAATPVRATQPVANYYNTGFVNKYSFNGVPISVRRAYIQ